MHLPGAAAVALVALVLSAATAAAQSTATPLDPLQVVNAFELARGANDVDAALAQLADKAVITVQSDATRSYAGSVQLRAYLQRIGTQSQTLTRSRPMVVGNSVTWTERDEHATQTVDTTVVAIVDSGRITSLIYRDNDPATVPGRPSPLTTVQPTQLPNSAWAAGLGVLGTGLLAGAFVRPRPKASRSQLNGRLLVALRRDREPGFDRAKRAG